jgi:hypothetical protein
MASLDRNLRRNLESAVKKARRVAEAGARQALEQLAVGHHEPWSALTPEQRKLRNRLRAHGRQLGDKLDERKGTQTIERLTCECAYEHWHRLLFARFLAENDLLVEPESGMALSLDECRELARGSGVDWLVAASNFAQRMLPQIFRISDPVLEVILPPEKRQELEAILEGLPREVFIAIDSLGWVYQYWQSEQKDVVNASENKIGADELPAVTQLFTEDYMVLFLLHNTLGAWWAGKVLAANPGLAESATSEDALRAACAVGDVEWTYLRFLQDEVKPWRPAAGCFEGWPKAAKDVKLLDPCMGSGHFLVFALPMLTAMRISEERLSEDAAIEAVLLDNLFGLEIDPRCTQIAAFNLALAAWRRMGYRQLPPLHLACSGLSLGVSKAEWLGLTERAAHALSVSPKNNLLEAQDNLFSDAMKRGFERMYDLFLGAPWLGSLIELSAAKGDLIEHGFTELEPMLAQVMSKADNADLFEMAVAAQGLAKAANLMTSSFDLVATNVPYLGRGKQDDILRSYCEQQYPDAKADLATCFLQRCSSWCRPHGAMALVTPQNWWFLSTFTAVRRTLLESASLNFLVTLGEEAWQSFGDRGPVASMIVASNELPKPDTRVAGIDAWPKKSIEQKTEELLSGSIVYLLQGDLSANPDSRFAFTSIDSANLLSNSCESWQGLVTSDNPRFVLQFWEAWGDGWQPFISSPTKTRLYGGRECVVSWSHGVGPLHSEGRAHNFPPKSALSRRGVLVSQVRSLAATIYTGEIFAHGSSPVIPSDEKTLAALWCFLSSDEYAEAVRAIDKKLAVTNGSLLKVEFDQGKWNEMATGRFPEGLPAPASSDPTQWLFDGKVEESDAPLQVATARLVGYKWPRQIGASFLGSGAIDVDELAEHADRDGIVALSPVKGEQSAAARLRVLLAKALGSEWSATKLGNLLAQVGFAGKSLDDWLRDGFFEQHCALFHQRPFVWHVWDGRRDGFHALVNYHNLAEPHGGGKRTLEKLLYSYLGDWIERQRTDQKAGAEGADARVAAAEHLKTELTKILAGEPPYDIFVRWKALAEQPIGWEPDINDGVRMNIRPLMTAKPLGARSKAVCILRTKPNMKWDKDRGKELQRPCDDFPWFWGWDESTQDFQGGKQFDGNRWNDLHYSRATKLAARERAKRAKS